MNQKGRDPRSPEAWQAVLRRMETMTKEEWEHWIEKLSRPPEGVEETWRNRDMAQANGSTPPTSRTDSDR